MSSVTEPYLLFSGVPITIDREGCPYTNPLWVKDLTLHLEYIENLSVACAVAHGQPSGDKVPIPLAVVDRITIVPLPAPHGRLSGWLAWPRTVVASWRAIGKARIVHTGFGAWPINLGWIACPIAKLRGRFLLTNVESSFWRARPGASLGRRLVGFVSERLNRLCVRTADLRLFTSTAYLREFLPEGAPRAFVNPASWIDDEWVLKTEDASAAWDGKSGPVRLLFAGRLIAEKGVSELLEAARTAGQNGAELELTIVGEGALRDLCLEASREPAGSVRIRALDPVPFGPSFFSLIARHDAVLVPSLTDEQPRILYDALSQAVPVIGSDTGGIREVIEPDMTGRLVPPSDVQALAQAMIWAASNRPALRAMGLRGLEVVRGRTHRAMHQYRSGLIRQALDEHR
ncbi:MAG: glycosyltransferase family 4 protein [Isosphaeraceae bacterium]